MTDLAYREPQILRRYFLSQHVDEPNATICSSGLQQRASAALVGMKLNGRNLEEIKDLGEEMHSVDVEDSYGIVSLSFNTMTNRKSPH